MQGQTHRSAVTGRYLKPNEIELQPAVQNGAAAAIERATGQPTVVSWEKMSKSKHNGVAPEDIVREHGADAARTFVLFKVK